MLDTDLAALYDVPTKRLNEQVKRNPGRFPGDFVFALTRAERNEVVANCDHLQRLKFYRLTPKDLAPVDEFHIGGRQATKPFAEQFGPQPGMRLLDIGCGPGGAVRYFASEQGCRVTGIELSREYVAVADAPAPLGLHIVIGARAAQKVKNMTGDIAAGPIAPIELIAGVREEAGEGSVA